MSPTTLEKPSPAEKTAASASVAAPPAAPARKTDRKIMLAGFDLGTNKSCILAGPVGATDITVSKIVPTVVGYVRDGIVDGIIAGNASILFGEDALKNALHVNLIAPLAKGVIAHPDAARDFFRHMRSLIDASSTAEIRAVIGVPANAEEDARENIRASATGVFDRVLLIPEPFLAALGYRDDARLNQPNYVDPVINSLFIDVGGGTSDLCLIQGYFPSREDQISVSFAGDAIDSLIHEDIDRQYPGNGLSRQTVREIKETHSYVGPIRKPTDVRVIIGGKARVLELGESIGRACNALLDRIYPALTTLIARASSDSV
ncbi:MAG TPA: rod shape-determining protein, partial [Opitutaceae bacterium]|nr:rod shape-determining protein [Opitutaceae bacterium]